MSVHVSSWAWKQEIGDDGAKLVLLKLADSANDDGVAWPARGTLMTECECKDERTIGRRLAKLKAAGLITVVPWFDESGRQSSSMIVMPHRGALEAADLAAAMEKSGRKGYAGNVVYLNDARGASAPPSPGAAAPPSSRALAPPSIEEPSVEPSEVLLPDKPGESIPDEDFERRFAVELALSAALDRRPDAMTSRELGQWRICIGELVAAGASGDDVTARCAAFRSIWPDAKLTSFALVKHWSLLGAEVDVKTSGFDAWLELAPDRFDRQSAHDVIDDAAALDEPERSRRHRLVDQRFDERREDAA